MININNISYCYPGQKKPVFSQFSLSLKEGTVYGLLGKNGTGKSTLLHLIAGLLRPKEGTVSVFGQSAVQRLPEVLGNFGH